MPRVTPPARPLWRRALTVTWSITRFAFRLFFILLMLVLPIPLFGPLYRPHRERRNHPAMVLRKD